MERIVEASGMLILTSSPPRKVLLLQHANRWDLPKGHADDGEDLLTTALRETEEETGIPAHRITIEPRFRFVIEYPVRGTRRGDYWKRVTYFLGYVESPLPIHLTEHIGYQWIEWPVNHSIQQATIDPLLKELDRFLHSSQCDLST